MRAPTRDFASVQRMAVPRWAVGAGSICVFHLLPAAELRSSQQANVLAPTEGVLDQFPRPEAQRISSVTSRAPVNRRTAIALEVLRHMGRGVDLAHLRDEAAVS